MSRSRAALLLLIAALSVGCAMAPPRSVKTASVAMAPATDTPSARYIQSELARHQRGISGFRLLTLNNNALLSRVTLADHAEHSIDLQYFIFKNDATGRLLAQHLLAAADRGVRVRMLLDDINLDNQRAMLDALDSHPNFEVRLFNPFRTREPTLLSKLIQVAVDGARLNRRMHNKSFLVDNKVAVIGGRNIGDDYFDANVDNNFRDLDLVAIGPVVAAASRSFDAYWNSDSAVPVTAYPSGRDKPEDLAALRLALARDARVFADSDYQQAAFAELPDGPTADRQGRWFWGEADLVADAPEKAEAPDRRRGFRIGPTLDATIQAARHDLLLVSPYFIPDRQYVAQLAAMAARGVEVKVLTNSLASTDEPAAYAKYSAHQKPLLVGGVGLYELRPMPGAVAAPSAHGTSSGVSLHAKAFVVDDHITFIGSMNMDERSDVVNTEMGLVVDNPALAAAVGDFFRTATVPASAFELRLSHPGTGIGGGGGSGHVVWWATRDGKPRHWRHAPETTFWQRLKMRLLRCLPIESLL